MNSASKVGEIFVEAGEAFNRLATMTVQLQLASPHPTNSGKWSGDETALLHKAVKRFGPDPQKISEVLKTRNVSQIRNALKTKAFEGTRTPSGSGGRTRPKHALTMAAQDGSGVTLNMLNAGGRAPETAQMALDVFDGAIEEVS